MTELVINRSGILQAKRQEIKLIATARKRKLRELYAIAYSDVVPQLAHLSANSPPPAPVEAQFLDENDITLGRVLNEASVPTLCRQLRSELSGRTTVGLQPAETTRSSTKGLHDGEVRRTSGLSPGEDLTHGNTDNRREGFNATQQNSPSKGLEENVASLGVRPLPSKESRLEASRDEDTPSKATATTNGEDYTPLPVVHPSQDSNAVGASEVERIRQTVESRPGSPGVNPREAIPMSADEAGQASSVIHDPRDQHHRAATVHLPSKDIQERHLKQVDHSIAAHTARNLKEDKAADLSIKLPPSHNARSTDVVSSPGSTVGAHSATTPGIHDTSTDTSPDNEGPRYSAVDRIDDKDESYPHTPPELLPSKEEASEKEEHDRLLRAQMDAARADILGSSPTAADAQLRFEEEQAASASSEDALQTNQRGVVNDPVVPEQAVEGSTAAPLEEPAQDLVDDDEDDEVVGVPTPEDERIPEPEVPSTERTDGVDMSSHLVDASEHVDTKTSDVRREPHPELPTQSLQRSENEAGSQKEVSTTSTAASAPRRMTSAQVPASGAERMTTRVSSGAIRHRSVSEIIGETPKSSRHSSLEKGDAISTDAVPNTRLQSHSTTPQSLSSRGRSLVQRTKDKERSRLSTVVFAKPSHKKDFDSTTLVSGNTKLPAHEHADYFMPLILAQAYNAARGIQPLDSLLQSAHKTITTSNAYVPFHEHQTQKILRRIHGLQVADKWSFRQPKRAPEPVRPTTHWDELQKEMKWMRTDFREERKWKMAVARNLAYACAEWIAAGSEDRILLQVKARPPKSSDNVTPPPRMPNAVSPSADDMPQPTPDLVPSAEHDSPMDDSDEEPGTTVFDAVAPTALFSLADDDVVFGLRRSAATDKMLEELPMYGTPLAIPQSDLPTSEVDPDASWRRPALPLSKYVEGKILLTNDGPPRKRSRYQYEEDSDDDEQVVFGSHGHRRSREEPLQVEVALFNPENKHIRDRIHAGHQFRPPSENPMPLQSFFECRSSSHWLWSEDDELKSLVREYSYNWQLISSMLSTKSLFASGAERRTPWECFERWIHLEGLPADMQKTHYFRAYNNRMEAAQRSLINQANQAQPQNNSAGAAVTPVRRRTTTSIRVERKRNQKHLTLVDAMRKLAKKRETSAQKQLQAAGLAAMRKTNDAPAQQGTRHTPQDFSRLKYERELQMQERLQRMQLQQEAQRRAMQQARTAQQQNPQQYGAPNGVPQPPRGTASSNTPGAVQHPAHANRPNQLAVPGQNLPQGPMQALPNGMGGQIPLPNGHGGVPQMPMKPLPQAQMQNMQGLQGQHRLPVPNPAPDLRLVMQARQISEQQRQAVQMQQQGQQHPGQNGQVHNSPPNMRASMNGMNQQNFMQNNQALLAGFNANNMNGVSTPPANGMQVPNNGSAGSPRMNNPNQPQQSHSNGSTVNIEVNQLEAQYQTQFPNAPPEQIRKMVSDTLKQRHAQRQQISQSAMHAAAGNGGGLAGLPGGMQHSPQQYAQMLRAQQERQSQAAQQNRSASAGSGVGK